MLAVDFNIDIELQVLCVFIGSIIAWESWCSSAQNTTDNALMLFSYTTAAAICLVGSPAAMLVTGIVWSCELVVEEP